MLSLQFDNLVLTQKLFGIGERKSIGSFVLTDFRFLFFSQMRPDPPCLDVCSHALLANSNFRSQSCSCTRSSGRTSAQATCLRSVSRCACSHARVLAHALQNLQYAKIHFPVSGEREFQSLHDLLVKFVSVASINDLFAFKFKTTHGSFDLFFSFSFSH